MPVVILFDLGGVLIDFAGFEEIRFLVPEPIEASEIRERWLMSEPVRDFDLGRIGPSEFAKRFVAEWKISLSPAEFLREFTDWLNGFYPGVQTLLRDLRTRHRLACLSNMNETHWSILRDSLIPHFESAFFSFELGLAKPDPAIFRAAMTSLGIDPHEVLFFDDSELNVGSAAEVGFHAELVCGPAELRERLIQLELL